MNAEERAVVPEGSVCHAWFCFGRLELYRFFCTLAAGRPRAAVAPDALPRRRSGVALVLLTLMLVAGSVSANTLCVDVNSTNAVSPYVDWGTAATNIQDAIDAAAAGDTVLVTNGIYATGGKVMYGDLANRVALDKALTVQSVNGPAVTTIQGAYTGSTGAGASSVRCAWLTNGASLVGFTLLGGATRISGDITNLQCGAGTWCASSNTLVGNCIIRSNIAAEFGGGAYRGSFSNCVFSGNSAYSGGGAYDGILTLCRMITNRVGNVGAGACGGTLRTCLIVSNSASSSGGAVYFATLWNCTVTWNTGGGAFASTLTNCIAYFNGSYGNFSGAAIAYSCTTPAQAGPGNIGSDPQLGADGYHLTRGSPCRGAGTNSVTAGLDIDGQPWADPPSMGCDEWQPAPVVEVPPRFQVSPYPAGFTVYIPVAGSDPFVCWWSRNGTSIEDGLQYSSSRTTNLVCNSIAELAGGSYQVVVSNAFGMATSAVAQVTVHCVDIAGTNAVAPYSTWATAATNIQDAITPAAAGDLVLVANGVYSNGGKSMDGIITNRVALDKAVMVVSVNGPGATAIEGAWGTNGPTAVRCVWMTNGTVLSGFTVRGGATRLNTGAYGQESNGGGLWGSWGLSNNPTAYNCMIVSNLASGGGGGAYQVVLKNCTLSGNQAVSVNGSLPAGGGGAVLCNLRDCVVSGNSANLGAGGGTASCNLGNCAVVGNLSYRSGAGAYSSILTNCTVSGNLCGPYNGTGSAVASAILTNCIVYGNFIQGTGSTHSNWYSCTFAYSDSDPLPGGTGNIDVDPQLLPDGYHIATGSPCRGAGTGVPAGTDIDGQPWASPPSMGCDEWQPAAVVAGAPQFQVGLGTRLLSLTGAAGGQAPIMWFWSKDGTLIQDSAHYSGSGSSNLLVNPFDAPDGGSYQFVVSNAFGMATGQVGQVVIHCADAVATNPAPPYAAWAAAAATIQDAIDVGAPGDIVLVTDGVYATGGKAMFSTLTNRVVLDRPLLVTSMHGYASTIIQGAAGAPANGPTAVRCAWLTNGATLAGFTLQGGATFAGPAYSLEGNCGGGVWCASNTCVVANCLIRSNTASYFGGAVYQGTINGCAIIWNVTLPPDIVGAGGTVYSASVNNCTVARNVVIAQSIMFPPWGWGGGLASCTAKNSIIWGNYAGYYPNCYQGNATNCDTTSDAIGSGNINADPQFIDPWHIFTTSPCRGAGRAAYATGVDIDGEAWANPPSIGCDEPVASSLVGPLSVSISMSASSANPYVTHLVTLVGQITGRAARLAWDFGDGTTATNVGYSTSHTWNSPGGYRVSLTAYNADYPDGVAGYLQVNVVPLPQPALTAVAKAANGFQLQIPAQSNLFYYVQRATNLTPPIAWQAVATIATNADGVLQILDGTVAGNAQFYRVQVK